MELTLQNLIQAGGRLLQDMAHTLQVTAAHLYEVLVRQQVIEGALGLFNGVALVLGSLAVVTLVNRKFSRHFKERYHPEDAIIVGLASLTCSVLVLSTLLPNVSVALNKMINPEYFALLRILQEVRQ